MNSKSTGTNHRELNAFAFDYAAQFESKKKILYTGVKLEFQNQEPYVCMKYFELL